MYTSARVILIIKITVGLLVFDGAAMSCTEKKDTQAENVLTLTERYDNAQENSIVIVYDNVVFNEELQADWGFAAVIRVSDHTILYDTGTQADVLFHNLKALRIDPANIDTVFISHTHTDHFGGLEGFLAQNPTVTLYLPANGFGRHRIKRIMSDNAEGRYVEIEDPVLLFDNVYATGQMKGIRGYPTFEQSLVIDTDHGGIVIAGCSHPDIVAIVKKAREIIKKDVFFVMGGFHLMDEEPAIVEKIIAELKAMGVTHIAPSHCTGTDQIKIFKEKFAARYIASGTGRVFSF